MYSRLIARRHSGTICAPPPTEWHQRASSHAGQRGKYIEGPHEREVQRSCHRVHRQAPRISAGVLRQFVGVYIRAKWSPVLQCCPQLSTLPKISSSQDRGNSCTRTVRSRTDCERQPRPLEYCPPPSCGKLGSIQDVNGRQTAD